MTNICIESYGCSSNKSEGEVMAGILEKKDFKIVEKPEDAELIILNICTVKGDILAINHVKDMKKRFPDKAFVVTGCVTMDVIASVRKFEPLASFLSTHNIKNIVEAVEDTLNKNPITMIAYSDDIKINLPRIRKSKLIAIIPIASGCNGECAYCSVRSIKGKLQSYAIEDIKAEAQKAVTQGCKELWITSQDNACYMLEKEKKSKLPELLKEIIAIRGDFKIRLGMMNPDNVKPIINELIEVYKSDKMFKFIHLPVQSGNEYVLKNMKRKYTLDEFKDIIHEFKKQIPDLTLATDVIVGFPGESRIFFSNTVDFVKQLMPDALYISRFRARPGTEAKKMDNQVDPLETKNRSTLLASIFNNISYMRNERWYGWKGKILIDEKGEGNQWIGHNYAYKPVIIEGDYEMGQEVKVYVKKITTFGLLADVL
ncbi:MAG: tRNA (N(6)-L-threonylcarbamoyladenosine(37)-C(2))-methylthiotransferase [Candidatus Woesearchaeota archaeon]